MPVPSRDGSEATTKRNLDSAIRAAVSQYQAAVSPPPLIDLHVSGPEVAARAVLAIALAQSPTYLGAVHLMPVVTSFCHLAGAERLADIKPWTETTTAALCMSMAGIDLTLSEAELVLERTLNRIGELDGDVRTAFAFDTDAEIRGSVESLFRGDPGRSQYFMDCARLDVRATPTEDAARTAVKIGVVHFSEGLFGTHHLRETTWTVLNAHPPVLWHALHFISAAICDSHLGCPECACREFCVALCEGWV